MISCKIIYKRDPNTLKITDKIQAVKAPNGKRSLLFDSIRNQINDDTKALTQYFKVYTDEFKESFGDWENIQPLKASSLKYNLDRISAPSTLVMWMYIDEKNGIPTILTEDDMKNIKSNSSWVDINRDRVTEIQSEVMRQQQLAKESLTEEEYGNILDMVEEGIESNLEIVQEIVFGDHNRFMEKLDQNGEPKYEEVKDLFIDEEVDEGVVDDTSITKSEATTKATELIMKSISKRINKPLAKVYDDNKIGRVSHNITKNSVIGAIASLTGVHIESDSIEILHQESSKEYSIPKKYTKNLELKDNDFFLSKVLDTEPSMLSGKRIKGKDGIKLSKRDSILLQIENKYNDLISNIGDSPYLASNLSKGYLEFAAKVAENNGEFDNANRLRNASDSDIKGMIGEVRKTQLADIQTWVNYLSSRPDYPIEFKYYVLNNVLKSNVVSVDTDKGKVQLTKRNKSSINSFESLNAKALANVYDKPNTANKFLYDYAMDMATTIAGIIPKEKEFERTPKGTWYKFTKGDADTLSSFVSDTPWCTGSYSTAKNQLNGGDFYVFNPINSEVNEKIAIRMNGDDIGEIRGTLNGQDLKDSSSSILDSFIKKRLPGQERSLNKLKYLKLRSEFKANTDLFMDPIRLREYIVYSKYNDSYGGDDFSRDHMDSINKGVDIIKQNTIKDVSKKLGLSNDAAEIEMIVEDHYSNPLDYKLRFIINYPDDIKVIVNSNSGPAHLKTKYSKLHYYNASSSSIKLDILNKSSGVGFIGDIKQRINIEPEQLVNIKSVYDKNYNKEIILVNKDRVGRSTLPGNEMKLGYLNSGERSNNDARKHIIDQINTSLIQNNYSISVNDILESDHVPNITIKNGKINEIKVEINGIKDIPSNLYNVVTLTNKDDINIEEDINSSIKNIKIAKNVFNKQIKTINFGGRYIKNYGFDSLNSDEYKELIGLVDKATIKIWNMN